MLLTEELRTTAMVAQRELRRFSRSRGRLLAGLIQPLTFLFILGFGLSGLVTAQRGDYVQFLFPGIIAMTVVASALISGASVVWDREFGFLREMLVSPARRVSLVAGKIAGGAAVAAAEGAILLVLAPVVGVGLDFLVILGVAGISALIAATLTAFGVLLATRIRSLESFQVIIQLVMMPMIFLSGTIFPLRDLPGWLTVLTHINPLAYAVDPLRRVLSSDPADGSARFDSGVELFGSTLPIAVELALVAGFALVFAALSVRAFGKPE